MDSRDACSGNDTTEAYALLLFANNYKVWLYDKEKLNHGEAQQSQERIGSTYSRVYPYGSR